MDTKILHTTHWAQSHLETPIELYRWRRNHTERPVLMIGGVHGDEPEGVWLAENLILWLKSHESLESLQKIRNFDLIPCLNVDGFKKLQRTNGRGVDLNRNFPTRDWSKEAKAPRYNPGPFPGSEAEVQSVVKLIEQTNPEMIVHFHSWEPCVVFTGDPGQNTAEIFSRSSGYKAQPDIGYPTPGSLGQYGWIEAHTPVICIEEKEGEAKDKIWPKFAEGFKELLLK